MAPHAVAVSGNDEQEEIESYVTAAHALQKLSQVGQVQEGGQVTQVIEGAQITLVQGGQVIETVLEGEQVVGNGHEEAEFTTEQAGMEQVIQAEHSPPEGSQDGAAQS